MSIVGFNFTKISAERKNAVVGVVNISNNIVIRDIAEAKIGLPQSQGALRVMFGFRSEYSPDLAVIDLEGEVILLLEAKLADDLVANWKKARIVPRQVAEMTMNHILDRCNIQALLLSKDLNLPSPVPLPKVRVDTPAAGMAPKPEAKPEKDMKTTKVKKK